MKINSVQGDFRVNRLIEGIVTSLTVATETSWRLVSPITLGEVKDTAILSTTTSLNQTFYIKLERPENSLTYINISFARNFDGDELTGFASREIRCSWYKIAPDLFLNETLPVKVYINFDTDSANIILQGDPAVDTVEGKNYLCTYLYMGICEKYEDGIEDTEGNFFITAGSDIRPVFVETPNFGINEGNGNIDLIAMGTRSGVPFQRHDVSINTTSPFIIKNITSESKYTNKFHGSDIGIVHSTDGERGKMRNVAVMPSEALNHTNIMIENKGNADERQWIFFDINAPFSFINNSANPKIKIAIRRA